MIFSHHKKSSPHCGTGGCWPNVTGKRIFVVVLRDPYLPHFTARQHFPQEPDSIHCIRKRNFAKRKRPLPILTRLPTACFNGYMFKTWITTRLGGGWGSWQRLCTLCTVVTTTPAQGHFKSTRCRWSPHPTFCASKECSIKAHLLECKSTTFSAWIIYISSSFK